MRFEQVTALLGVIFLLISLCTSLAINSKSCVAATLVATAQDTW